MIQAGREHAGDETTADPPGLGQASLQVSQVVEAERGHHQVEAAVPERQRDRVGRDPGPGRAGHSQHAHRKVGPHDLTGPRGQRGPGGRPGAGTHVEHPAAGQRPGS